MKTTFVAIFLVTAFSLSVLGDIPRPKTPTPKPGKPFEGRIYIDLKSDVTVPTLKIRREALKQLLAAIDEADDGQNAAVSAGTGLTRAGTIASGLLFSLAFVFAGVLLFRRGGMRPSRLAISAAGLVVVGVVSLVVFANSPPPGVVNLTTRIFEKNTKAYGYATGNVKIVVLDRQPGVFTGNDRDDVILEIPNGGEAKDTE